MRIAVNQPYFFPYLGFFEMLSKVDVFIIHEDVKFNKKSWINRNRINSPYGVKYLTAPTLSEDKQKLIYQVRLNNNDKNWRVKLSRQFWNYYHTTPNFIDVWNIFEKVIFEPVQSVSELSTLSLKSFSSYFGLNVDFVSSLEFEIPCDLRGVDRLKYLVTQTGANEYWNLPNGNLLYKQSDFDGLDCEVKFINHTPPHYYSLVGLDEPRLSILDVACHIDSLSEGLRK